jgi:hypothetical protein
MPKYKVEVKEVHIQTYTVDEDCSPEEAKEKVFDKEEYLNDGDFVYSHTLEPETWYVTKVAE